MAWLDLTIATKADGPLKTVKDIVAAAKKNPGKLNFGTIAPGSTQHLSAVLFMLTGDIKVTMVTFRTTPDLVTALLRGDVDVGFDYLAGLHAQLNGQQLRAVASTGEKRSPSTPDVPTVQESGMPDYVVTSWNAVSAPAGTPDDIVQFLSKEIQRGAEIAGHPGQGAAVRARRPRHHAGGDAGAHARRHREMGRGDREGRARKAMTAKVPSEDRRRHIGAYGGGQGRNRPDRRSRGEFRRGGADHRGVPPDGARRRVRRLRDGADHLSDRAGARRAVYRAADLRHAALPSRRLRGPARCRHQEAEGPRRQARRRARLFGDDGRVDARHFHQRVWPRRLEGDLGGGRRGACHDAEAAGQRHPCAAGPIAGEHDGERRIAGGLHRPGRHRARRRADRELGARRPDAGAELSGAYPERRRGRGRLVSPHRHLSDPRHHRGEDRCAGKASQGRARAL